MDHASGQRMDQGEQRSYLWLLSEELGQGAGGGQHSTEIEEGTRKVRWQAVMQNNICITKEHMELTTPMEVEARRVSSVARLFLPFLGSKYPE